MKQFTIYFTDDDNNRETAVRELPAISCVIPTFIHATKLNCKLMVEVNLFTSQCSTVKFGQASKLSRSFGKKASSSTILFWPIISNKNAVDHFSMTYSLMTLIIPTSTKKLGSNTWASHHIYPSNL